MKDLPQGYDYFRNKVGRVLKSSEGKDTVEIEGILHVIVAQKQKNK